MRVTRTQLIVMLLAAAVAVVGTAYVRRWMRQPQTLQQRSASPAQNGAGAYADPTSCAECHDEIARTYGLTGMARSFAKLRPEAWPGAGGALGSTRLHHAASDRHYTMIERGGRFFQRRHGAGFNGDEANVVELEATHVVGSGNHARTFLHRSPDGRLREMPVSWYADRGGYWAMSPGYDRPAHLDFRRVIMEDCMSCHNGYPRAGVQNDGTGPRFAEPLPEGIDCQRCHGPGQAHIDAIRAGDVERARRVVVNPATLERERQLETCMQCHLETTSSPLPFQIRRYEHAPFSYIPGKALSDYFLHFDHAPGSGRDDKFEIAGGAYRLRKSACFQRSEMTCVTCHDPHDIPRGEKAVQHYVSVCQSCHQDVHLGGTPRVQHAGARATCLDCHMPKRRAEDAVHTVITDHYIQRRRAAADLLAPRKEADNFEDGDYRGEVVPYYPPEFAPTPENELYTALAQVQQGSNLTAGIPRLEQAIGRHEPARANFYHELARAYVKTSNYDAAIRWSEEALRRDATFAPALKELAGAATALGRFAQAAQALERAVALRPADGDAWADLGNVYLQDGRPDEAQRALQRALALDATMPRANNTMALAALRKGETNAAETYFREAIRHQPELAEAQNNLGNLLAGRKAYAEAGHHFEKAIRANPSYVEARHSYGMVLALTGAYPRAAAELEAVLRASPSLLQASLDLGDVYAAMQRTRDAARAYERAAQSSDPEIRRAALNALDALRRR
ncbi:MAG: tetratricopeptide repeat protein [Acidobacteria bacterium]|nr:MAG: tetratricopeptide repeat protein [Acidobacteriota bacterium]